FAAADQQNVTHLYVQDLAAKEARLLEGTDGAMYPFWSPDGRWVGFFAGGKLNKIDSAGGPVIPLCDATDGRGGSWNRDGVILFQPRFSETIFKVPAGGGTPEQVTHLNKEHFDLAHRWPLFMPDGKHFLFYVVSTSNPSSSEFSGIYAGSLDSADTRMLLRVDSRMAYAAGHMLYKQGASLMAQPFDPDTMELRGDPTPIAADVTGGAYSWGGAQFGVSGPETLVYMSGLGQGETELTQVDRSGKKTGEIGERGFYASVRLSHSGKRFAYEVGRDASDIWVYDFDRKISTRFTFDPASDNSPVWSPDDKRIAFVSSRKGLGELWVKDASGTGEETLLYASGSEVLLTDWSPDGRYLIYSGLKKETGFDIWVYPLGETKARPWLELPNDQLMMRFSPDGRWVVYTSNESGREEVYVQSFPDSDRGRWQISRTGGTYPVWRADGREIVFMDADGTTLMSVDVQPGASPKFGTPQPLFPAAIRSSAGNTFDVSADGQMLLLASLEQGAQTEPSVHLVLNWTQSLNR
ncbi:MAG TPA: hypothetical protein VNI57_11355, partial [Candidatus Saccharimonadales bacterium]|nr:hypothetical protein [Candidatus Saccharimonadales bacterium]